MTEYSLNYCLKTGVHYNSLPSADWVQQTKVEANMKVVSWNLGAGETAILSFALHNPQYSAIIDDRAARRCAHVLNISLLGTAGVIVLAKRRGLIGSVETGLRQLQMAGLWLSEELIQTLSLAEDGAA